MDPQRFDTFTKQLAQTPSRRVLLKTVGGALGAVGLALRGGGAPGHGRCRTRDELCHRNSECCSNHCRLVSADPMRGRCN